MIQPCPVLDAAGLPGPDLALAHGIQLSETDMTLMVEHGVALAVTPISELRLELRMPPLTELRRHGITIGLGFDNPAFAGSMDMFAAMRVAWASSGPARVGSMPCRRTMSCAWPPLTARDTWAWTT